MAENRYNGVERRVLLPLHDGKQAKQQPPYQQQQPRPQGMRSPATLPETNSPKMAQAQRQRPTRNKWAQIGPGMQAIFLGSGPQIGGTGVFIPRTEGVQFSKKAAFSPVLMPVRVIQTLNLNVNEIGSHNETKPDKAKKVDKKDDEKSGKKEIDEDVIYISPDIVLPKEWTY